MRRKRAAFPEGIAEEEQRYAQVLREIRDLRGRRNTATWPVAAPNSSERSGS